MDETDNTTEQNICSDMVSTPDFDLRRLGDLLNTGETWGQKVSPLRSFEPKRSLQGAFS
jgi:hypothetical protein